MVRIGAWEKPYGTHRGMGEREGDGVYFEKHQSREKFRGLEILFCFIELNVVGLEMG